jgi:hypothetical protein
MLRMRQLSFIGKLAFCFICGLVFVSHVAHAEVSANDPQWLSLSYYHKNIMSGFESEILNDDYFVAQDGRTNPARELEVFRELMQKQQQGIPQDDMLCRFPARMTFLQKSDPAFANFSRPECTEYIKQNRPEDITSISLVFASGYFDNPGSYFGHTMLKYNYGDNVTDQNTIDASLNYGANNTDVPSSPMYAIRGIFGGYNASYKRNNDLLNTHQYTNMQIRDLWEYRLALTPKQRQFVIEHSWEMMRAKFTYYFFNDNCAHRIARIIEKSTGRDLTKVSGFWLLPTQVVRHLKANTQQPSLVEDGAYLPSLKTEFAANYATLNNTQRTQFLTFLKQSLGQQRTSVSKLSPQLLALSLSHFDLELAKQKDKPKHAGRIKAINETRGILLLEMMRREPNDLALQPPVMNYQTITDSRPASQLRLDAGTLNNHGLVRLSYRSANNDLLDKPLSGQEISRFLMGAARLDIAENKVKLRKVTAIEILNLNTNPLPMSLTNEFSWGLRIDYAPRNELCIDCESAGIEAKFGRAFRINKNMLLYGLAGGRAHSEEHDTRSYGNLVAEAAGIFTVSDSLAFHTGAQFTRDATHEADDITFTFEARQQLDYNSDWRLNATTSGSQSLLTTGVALYFD